MDFFATKAAESSKSSDDVDGFAQAIANRFKTSPVITANLNPPPPKNLSTPSVALPPDRFKSILPKDIQPYINDPNALFIDIRPHAAFASARLPNALSLSVPSTLLKRPLFPLERLAAMLPSLSARNRFNKWRQTSTLIVYDADSSGSVSGHLPEGNNILGLLRKFVNDPQGSYSGQLLWLKGGFQSVWKERKDLVDTRPVDLEADEDEPSSMLRPKNLPMSAFGTSSTTMNKNSLQSSRVLATRPGPRLPPSVAFNPFFDTIRQNVELSQGITERIPLRIPKRVRRRLVDLPFAWLQEIARRADVKLDDESPSSESDHYSTSSSSPNNQAVSTVSFPSQSSSSLSSSDSSLTPPDSALVDEGMEALAMQFYRIELAEQRRLMGVMQHHAKESEKMSGSQPAQSQPSLASKSTMQVDSEPSGHDSSSKHSQLSNISFPYSITAGIEKGAKNRYRHIWPFEHARVRLHQEHAPTDSGSYPDTEPPNPRFLHHPSYPPQFTPTTSSSTTLFNPADAGSGPPTFTGSFVQSPMSSMTSTNNPGSTASASTTSLTSSSSPFPSMSSSSHMRLPPTMMTTTAPSGPISGPGRPFKLSFPPGGSNGSSGSSGFGSASGSGGKGGNTSSPFLKPGTSVSSSPERVSSMNLNMNIGGGGIAGRRIGAVSLTSSSRPGIGAGSTNASNGGSVSGGEGPRSVSPTKSLGGRPSARGLKLDLGLGGSGRSGPAAIISSPSSSSTRSGASSGGGGGSVISFASGMRTFGGNTKEAGSNIPTFVPSFTQIRGVGGGTGSRGNGQGSGGESTIESSATESEREHEQDWDEEGDNGDGDRQRMGSTRRNREEYDDYVNASYVQPLCTTRRYIATQGPLEATFTDFWTIVYQQNVHVIVMLTREVENSMVKCGPYWKSEVYGPLRLKLIDVEGTEDDDKVDVRKASDAEGNMEEGADEAGLGRHSQQTFGGGGNHPSIKDEGMFSFFPTVKKEEDEEVKEERRRKREQRRVEKKVKREMKKELRRAREAEGAEGMEVDSKDQVKAENKREERREDKQKMQEKQKGKGKGKIEEKAKESSQSRSRSRVDSKRNSSTIIKRTFLLSHTYYPHVPPRKVVQFQYLGWPDMNVPGHSAGVLRLIREVNQAVEEGDYLPREEVEEEMQKGNKQPRAEAEEIDRMTGIAKHTMGKGHAPVLLHCSAGVGRTGGFIVVDAVLDGLRRELRKRRKAEKDAERHLFETQREIKEDKERLSKMEKMDVEMGSLKSSPSPPLSSKKKDDSMEVDSTLAEADVAMSDVTRSRSSPGSSMDSSRGSPMQQEQNPSPEETLAIYHGGNVLHIPAYSNKGKDSAKESKPQTSEGDGAKPSSSSKKSPKSNVIQSPIDIDQKVQEMYTRPATTRMWAENVSDQTGRHGSAFRVDQARTAFQSQSRLSERDVPRVEAAPTKDKEEVKMEMDTASADKGKSSSAVASSFHKPLSDSGSPSTSDDSYGFQSTFIKGRGHKHSQSLSRLHGPTNTSSFGTSESSLPLGSVLKPLSEVPAADRVKQPKVLPPTVNVPVERPRTLSAPIAPQPVPLQPVTAPDLPNPSLTPEDENRKPITPGAGSTASSGSRSGSASGTSGSSGKIEKLKQIKKKLLVEGSTTSLSSAQVGTGSGSGGSVPPMSGSGSGSGSVARSRSGSVSLSDPKYSLDAIPEKLAKPFSVMGRIIGAGSNSDISKKSPRKSSPVATDLDPLAGPISAFDYAAPRELHLDMSPRDLSNYTEPLLEVVQDMRQQRMSLCQSLRQYVFVHAAILEGALMVVDEENEKESEEENEEEDIDHEYIFKTPKYEKILNLAPHKPTLYRTPPSNASNKDGQDPVAIPSSKTVPTINTGKRLASPTELPEEDKKGRQLLHKKPSIKRKPNSNTSNSSEETEMKDGIPTSPTKALTLLPPQEMA
ncbi:hypothetical protein K435DRAFT_761108 [Dendrothele bispora CBS 962.96]|uniref:protein-tyrosine-phosphatase n=1 Tax=Dendrothele bispora (strain CBS 962.96) TaxID=1314807 RepID=A0A4S8LJU6_DENBC|nr:hypothetical protein K435DRAFT_761108 [Dendrothele bispora CBS 962.96]